MLCPERRRNHDPEEESGKDKHPEVNVTEYETLQASLTCQQVVRRYIPFRIQCSFSHQLTFNIQSFKRKKKRASDDAFQSGRKGMKKTPYKKLTVSEIYFPVILPVLRGVFWFRTKQIKKKPNRSVFRHLPVTACCHGYPCRIIAVERRNCMKIIHIFAGK
jgi:hypothetical protein